jgi:site-specific DNA-cytosine methylase
VGGHTGIYRIGTALDVKGHDYNKRVYSQDGKSPSLAAHTGGNLEPKIAMNEYTYRKLTVLECERLQTVPEGYTEGVSNTQRYRMLGNGWTIDVIAHIFKHMEI